MKKYQKILLGGLLFCSFLVLLAIFEPDFIKGTIFANILTNDNLNNFLVLIDIIITISLILFQDYDIRKSVFMKFCIVPAECNPGSDRMLGTSPVVCQVLRPSSQPMMGQCYYIQAFRDQLPQKIRLIPIEATLQTETDVIAFSISHLRITYKTEHGEIELPLSDVFLSDFLIHRGILQSGDKILLYISLWLSTQIDSEITDNCIYVSFTEKFTNKFKQITHRTVTLKIAINEDEMQLVEQY